MKILVKNRKAFHLFNIVEKIEAGLALKGTEVKSIRQGKVNFVDSFAKFKDGEMFLSNLDVRPYEQGNIFNHEARRERKLLLHKREISRLWSMVAEKGLSLVPLLLYLNDKGKIKVEIGVGRGKRTYDKRHQISKREAKRDIRHFLKTR
jgi:SsrA-binding protein